MMFIEVFAPTGALSDRQRRLIGERFVTDVMYEDSAPTAVIQAGQALCQVVFCDTVLWTVGGQAVDPGGPPRYVVRVTVPESWRESMSSYLIEAMTRILAEIEAEVDPTDGELLHTEPLAWIQVVGVAEGSLGSLGRVMGSTDLVKLITESYRSAPESQRPAVDLPPGTALDPVCGMTVPLEHAAATEHQNGTTYAFCSAGCHEVYLEEHPAAAT